MMTFLFTKVCYCSINKPDAMRKIIYIPSIKTTEVCLNPLAHYITSQPIMELKELEVDHVRYEQWKLDIQRKNYQRGRPKF
jgi:hypothetical protein